MWRRLYLVLVLVRLYFALSPSYLHPDENFQGPEVIAGEFLPPPKRLVQQSCFVFSLCLSLFPIGALARM